MSQNTGLSTQYSVLQENSALADIFFIVVPEATELKGAYNLLTVALFPEWSD